MVAPPKEKRIPIPEEFQTVTKRMKVADSRLEWREILCETNTTPDVVRRLQSALLKAGYNPGPIDGVLGLQTKEAVSKFQKANGLAEGELTMSTLRKLKVM
jgi:peptidoglycan hydrolase-like protein with peptidoglycan-binding domain